MQSSKKENNHIKYIVVCGASASAIGKGITVSSIAALMQAAGHIVTMIKIDPYLNIDAGTMSPFEHGEVFVLDDGAEADLDLGNYERFLNINLQGIHNITTGKVYQQVLEKERRGDFLGKTVQIVPHVTNAIIEWIEKIATIPADEEFNKPTICLIELGGTVGDIESNVFLEALRQMQAAVGHNNMAICLVCFVPVFGSEGQPKTKPAQHGFKELRYAGLTPDLIVARSESPLDNDVLEKLRLFSGVAPKNVINVPDLDSVYKVPLALNDSGITQMLSERLNLPVKAPNMKFWKNYYVKDIQLKNTDNIIPIAFVGKYIEFKDAYISVIKAFEQTSIETGLKVKLIFVESETIEEANAKNKEKSEKYHQSWEVIKNAHGVFVPGGFGFRGTEGKIAAIKYARENKIPFFGICYGFQLAVVEFCRNVLKWNAISEENVNEYEKSDSLKKVIIYMPDVSKNMMGGTMRLGKKRVLIDQHDSWANKIYGSNIIYERHRHRYEVEPSYVQTMNEAGLTFSAYDETRCRMEMLEIKDHPFFFATQFHPELRARLARPSPPFLAFVLAAAKKINYDTQVQGGILNYLASTLQEKQVDSPVEKVEK